MVLPLEQKTVRGLTVPAIWIGQLFDKFRRTGGAEIGFQIAATQRVVGNDAINAPQRIALEEIDLLPNLFGDGLRRLDHLSVDVGHVEIAVGCVGEVAGPEPDIGGCQELGLLRSAMRGEGGPVGPEDVAVDQVAADIAGEYAAGILLGKRVAGVERTAGGGGEPAADLLGDVHLVFVVALLSQSGALPAPALRSGERIHGGGRTAVIGDVLRHRANFQQGRARQVLHGHHDMADVGRVLRDEAVIEVVQGGAELRRAGCRFGPSADGVEAEIRAAHQDGLHLGMAGRSNAAVGAVVGAVDPVIDAEPRIGDASLLVHLREAGVKHLAYVGLSVAVGVFEKQDVGRAGDDQPALPRHEPADGEDVVGEDGAAPCLAVAVEVFEHADARTGGLSGRRVLGIVHHFGDVDFAVFVEGHFDRTHDVGFGGEEFGVEVFAPVHRL